MQKYQPRSVHQEKSPHRNLSREEERRRRQMRRERAIKKRNRLLLAMGVSFILLLLLLMAMIRLIQNIFGDEEIEVKSDTVVEEIIEDADIVQMPEIDEQLITINEYSRPGYAIEEVQNIVIHYTGNPGTTAQQNRDYYEELSESGEASVSSNFVIGMDGEIILCVPMDEVAYASNDANSTSLSIEVCHEDETGAFTDEAYEAVVYLTAWLCQEFDLTSEDVIRHYDVTGKECPLYYVENESEWILLKEDVATILLNGSL